MDLIEVKYLILKRKLYEKVDFPQKRVQVFSPANGKVSMNKVNKKLDGFINSCFMDDGSYSENEFFMTNDPYNCKYCDYRETEYCGGLEN